MYHDSLWTEATRDYEAEEVLRRQAMAREAAGPLWAYASLATSEADLGMRLTLVEARIVQEAERHGIEPSEVRDRLVADWRLMAEAKSKDEDDDEGRPDQDQDDSDADDDDDDDDDDQDDDGVDDDDDSSPETDTDDDGGKPWEKSSARQGARFPGLTAASKGDDESWEDYRRRTAQEEYAATPTHEEPGTWPISRHKGGGLWHSACDGCGDVLTGWGPGGVASAHARHFHEKHLGVTARKTATTHWVRYTDDHRGIAEAVPHQEMMDALAGGGKNGWRIEQDPGRSDVVHATGPEGTSRQYYAYSSDLDRHSASKTAAGKCAFCGMEGNAQGANGEVLHDSPWGRMHPSCRDEWEHGSGPAYGMDIKAWQADSQDDDEHTASRKRAINDAEMSQYSSEIANGRAAEHQPEPDTWCGTCSHEFADAEHDACPNCGEAKNLHDIERPDPHDDYYDVPDESDPYGRHERAMDLYRNAVRASGIARFASDSALCPTCKGSGAHPWDSFKSCPKCKGTGVKKAPRKQVADAMGVPEREVQASRRASHEDGVCVTCGEKPMMGWHEHKGYREYNPQCNDCWQDESYQWGHGLGRRDEARPTGEGIDDRVIDALQRGYDDAKAGRPMDSKRASKTADHQWTPWQYAQPVSGDEVRDTPNGVIGEPDVATADEGMTDERLSNPQTYQQQMSRQSSRIWALIREAGGATPTSDLMPGASQPYEGGSAVPSADALTSKPRQMPSGGGGFDPASMGQEQPGAPAPDAKQAHRQMVAYILRTNPGLSLEAAREMATEAAALAGVDPRSFGSGIATADGILSKEVLYKAPEYISDLIPWNKVKLPGGKMPGGAGAAGGAGKAAGEAAEEAAKAAPKVM